MFTFIKMYLFQKHDLVEEAVNQIILMEFLDLCKESLDEE